MSLLLFISSPLLEVINTLLRHWQTAIVPESKRPSFLSMNTVLWSDSYPSRTIKTYPNLHKNTSKVRTFSYES